MKGLSEASQNMRRPILDRLCNMCGPSGQRYGDKNFAAMQRRHVLTILEGMTYDAKKNWLKTVRGLTIGPSQPNCALMTPRKPSNWKGLLSRKAT